MEENAANSPYASTIAIATITKSHSSEPSASTKSKVPVVQRQRQRQKAQKQMWGLGGKLADVSFERKRMKGGTFSIRVPQVEKRYL